MSKVIQIFAKDALRVDGAPKAEHLFALYDDGTIRERFSDMPEGEWTLVPTPAIRKQRKRKKSRVS